MKNKIYESLEHGILGYLSQFLVIIFVIIFTIESTPSAQVYAQTLHSIDFAILILFSAEYILRILVTPNRLKYMFSFFGIIDFLAIVPFIVTFGIIDAKFIRLVRVIRIFKLLKNDILNKALKNIHDSLYNVKYELSIFTLIAIIFIYLSAVGIHFFESTAQPEQFGSILDALWWSLISLTTVGYGDSYPITAGGKVFSSAILFIGLGLVAIPTGIIASSFTNVVKKDRE
jgi:voltage-gated potassium channel